MVAESPGAAAAVDPERLRGRLGERLRFRFEGGGEMTGTLLEVRPVVGTPLLALLADADFFDGGGRCLQHLAYLPLVLGRLEAVEPAPL
jgi:hypothetical protein